MSTPVSVSTVAVAAPHGTCGAQTTTLTSGLARSAKPTMPTGFPGGVTIVRMLPAKLTGVPDTRFAAVALVMLLVSADANTSAGAPAVSWVTRSEDPAKLKVTVDPGFSVWKIVPISVCVAFKEAAANTVNVPAGTEEAAALEDAALEAAAVELNVADELAADE